MSKRDLFSRLKKFDRELEKVPDYVTGLLGIPLGGEKLVEVPTRNSYVFVRLRDSQDELVQAFNDKVSPVYGLPVIAQYKDGRYVIIGRDTNRYGDWGDFSAYLPRHGSTHSRSSTGGGDVVWVYSNQFMPYLAQPSGTVGSPHVVINDYLYLKSDGTWRFDDQVGTASLLGYKPTGSGAVMVLIYRDGDAGTLAYSVGSNFSESLTGTTQIDSYIPSLADTTQIPIAAVRLVSGTSVIGWDNIYDARQFFSRGGGTSFTGSTVGVYDEGVLQGQVTSLDFVGVNVDATVSGTRARVFITGSTGGLSSIAVQDEGIAKGNVTTFNFMGTGVDVSVSGTVAKVLVSGTYEMVTNLGNISNPPTQLELNFLIGNPIDIGMGKLFYLNDAARYDREYLALSDGIYWWTTPTVKTYYVELVTGTASNAASPLTIPTHDGGGQAVHPDVIDVGVGNTWNGFRYWMAMTPYPGSDQSYEKVNVIASNDGNSWVVPAGLTNPINTPPVGAINSDAEILLTPDGLTLWAIYRESDDPTNTYDKICGRSSSNGISWAAETVLISGDWAKMLSPSALYDGSQYVMWMVDSTTTLNSLTRRTCSSITGTWSSASTCTLINTPAGKEMWHLKIIKRGNIYHGFFVMCDIGSSGGGSILYFATSTDGITWTLNLLPLLSPSAGWDDDRIYTSAGCITANGYDLFYSAMTTAGSLWNIARTSVTLH